MTDYLKELETIQTWIKATAGINSERLSAAKPKLPRPVILWEAPGRGKDRHISQYVYVIKIRQYGRLFPVDLDQATDIQNKLFQDLEIKENVLPIVTDGQTIGYLKAVTLEFSNSNSLDIPFNIAYEATYSRPKPAEAPPATKVTNRIVNDF